MKRGAWLAQKGQRVRWIKDRSSGYGIVKRVISGPARPSLGYVVREDCTFEVQDEKTEEVLSLNFRQIHELRPPRAVRRARYTGLH